VIILFKKLSETTLDNFRRIIVTGGYYYIVVEVETLIAFGPTEYP
jgi:hypothetical protein